MCYDNFKIGTEFRPYTLQYIQARTDEQERVHHERELKITKDDLFCISVSEDNKMCLWNLKNKCLEGRITNFGHISKRRSFYNFKM